MFSSLRKTHLPLYPQHTQGTHALPVTFFAKSHLALPTSYHHPAEVQTLSRNRSPLSFPLCPARKCWWRDLVQSTSNRSYLSQPEKSGDSFTPFLRGSCGPLQFSWIGPRPQELVQLSTPSPRLPPSWGMLSSLAQTLELLLCYMTRWPCSVPPWPHCAYPRGRLPKVALQN